MYEYKATTIAVVDGDTYDFEFSLGMNAYLKERVRLANGDTPEVYGRATKNEKVHGKLASNFIKSVLNGQVVIVRTGIDNEKKGKYGRWIARVLVPFAVVSEMFDMTDVDPKSITNKTFIDLGALLQARNLIKWKPDNYRDPNFDKKIAKVEKNLAAKLSWKIVESKLLINVETEGLIKV